jgi:hypothetical protein
MFKFTDLLDLIQFFANEWCLPQNNILIVGNYDQHVKKIFDFINCETFFVNNGCLTDQTFFVQDLNDLPFQEKSFDAIVTLNEKFNKSYLKPGGVVLTNSEILNAKEYFWLNNSIFSVC